MKTILIMAFVVLLALIVLNRQREYLRDPLATVYRNNVKQDGVEVYQNYSNDILLIKEDDPGADRILVQEWNQMPATPERLTCIHWMACLTDADRAAATPLAWTGKGKYDPKVTMTNRTVSFVDGDGAAMRVELR